MKRMLCDKEGFGKVSRGLKSIEERCRKRKDRSFTTALLNHV
jgi:hypothetical protein